jgi:hypothetical protein
VQQQESGDRDAMQEPKARDILPFPASCTGSVCPWKPRDGGPSWGGWRSFEGYWIGCVGSQLCMWHAVFRMVAIWRKFSCLGLTSAVLSVASSQWAPTEKLLPHPFCSEHRHFHIYTGGSATESRLRKILIVRFVRSLFFTPIYFHLFYSCQLTPLAPPVACC